MGLRLVRKAYTKIYEVVKRIPEGKVVTYGMVTRWVGTSPRAVGNALHQNPDPKNIPCHRVVDRNGRLAPNYGFGGWRKQRRKLLAEGVEFKDKGHVDLEKHLWQKPT